jgi:hypothetical protein
MEMLFICSVDRASEGSYGGEIGHSRMNVLYPKGDADSTAGSCVSSFIATQMQNTPMEKEIKSNQGKKESSGTGFSSFMVLLVLQTNKNSHKNKPLKYQTYRSPYTLFYYFGCIREDAFSAND